MITRRDLLTSTAIVTACAADMLGPNGSWGPVLWDHEEAVAIRSPKTIPIDVAFSGTITGKLSLGINVVKNV